MKKRAIVIGGSAIIIIIILGIFFFPAQKAGESYVEINNKKISIEIADSPEERQQGLMFRTSLSEDQGMLFIFEQSAQVSFWMKNTLIPLDIVFIDENKQIADIQTAQPCTADPCTLYKPPQPVLYVLEVNAGFAEKYGIKVGDKVEINLKD